MRDPDAAVISVNVEFQRLTEEQESMNIREKIEDGQGLIPGGFCFNREVVIERWAYPHSTSSFKKVKMGKSNEMLVTICVKIFSGYY